MRARTASVADSTVAGPSSEDQPRANTPRVQISEVEIVDFCSRSGDDNGIHYKQPRIVPALLVMEKLARLFQQANLVDGIPMFREIIRHRFPRALYGGDFIYATYSMQTVKTIVRLGIRVVVVSFKVYNQVDQMVGEGEWEMTILPKPNSN